jgi:hypothetical protein
MSLNRLPILKIDPKSRSISVEAAGIRASGVRLGKMLVGTGEERNIRRFLTSSESFAKKLSDIGWTLTLYDGSSALLGMGSDVSGLTGHVKANPLRLRKLLRML